MTNTIADLQHCPQAIDRGDGTCNNCGRPIAVYSGVLHHKRGRKAEATRDQRVAWLRLSTRPHCRDCGADLQLIPIPELGYEVWRCPWTTTTRWELDESSGTLVCNKPRGKAA